MRGANESAVDYIQRVSGDYSPNDEENLRIWREYLEGVIPEETNFTPIHFKTLHKIGPDEDEFKFEDAYGRYVPGNDVIYFTAPPKDMKKIMLNSMLYPFVSGTPSMSRISTELAKYGKCKKDLVCKPRKAKEVISTLLNGDSVQFVGIRLSYPVVLFEFITNECVDAYNPVTDTHHPYGKYVIKLPLNLYRCGSATSDFENTLNLTSGVSRVFTDASGEEYLILENTSHPHVYYYTPCLGEGKFLAIASMITNRWDVVMDVHLIMLKEIDETGSYTNEWLTPWRSDAEEGDNLSSCERCGRDDIPEDEMYTCESCGMALCENCSYSCSGCDNTFCDLCLQSCDVCGQAVCPVCRVKCPSCARTYCRSCADDVNLTLEGCDKCEGRKTAVTVHLTEEDLK